MQEVEGNKVKMFPPYQTQEGKIRHLKATSGKAPAMYRMCGAAGGIRAEGTEE